MNVGKYTIHGAYGLGAVTFVPKKGPMIGDLSQLPLRSSFIWWKVRLHTGLVAVSILLRPTRQISRKIKAGATNKLAKLVYKSNNFMVCGRYICILTYTYDGLQANLQPGATPCMAK